MYSVPVLLQEKMHEMINEGEVKIKGSFVCQKGLA